MARDIFLPSVKKKTAPHRGAMSSADYNAFQDYVISDVNRISTVLNNISARFDKKTLQLESELDSLRAELSHIKDERTLENKRRALAGEDLVWFCGFSENEDLLYDGIDDERKLEIDRTAGLVFLPRDKSISRLYSYNPVTDNLFVPDDLIVTVSPYNEGSGSVRPGSPSLAVDGRPGEGFIRKVSFPTSSDQRAVIMDVTIDVSALYEDTANLLTLLPSPSGQVDILNIWYSSTDADPSTVLQEYDETGSLSAFTPRYECHKAVIHFADTTITSLKVRLQQRNPVIQNNEKIFMYGLREVHLDLVQWDKTAFQATWKASNVLYYKLSAPTGYTFATLKDLRSVPDFSTLTSTIRYGIFSDAALTSSIWESDSDPALSSSSIDVSSQSYSDIYIALRMTYDTSNNVSPIARRFYLRYTVQ